MNKIIGEFSSALVKIVSNPSLWFALGAVIFMAAATNDVLRAANFHILGVGFLGFALVLNAGEKIRSRIHVKEQRYKSRRIGKRK